MAAPEVEEHSAFWVRKMKTVFRRLDSDGDGTLTQRDVDIIADRWIEFGNLNEEDGDYMKKAFTQIYKDYYQSEGGTTDMDSYLKKVGGQTKEKLFATTSAVFPRFFKIIDSNHDGFIDKKEFSIHFKACGMLDEKMALEAFKHIDTNHDEVISTEEFNTAGNNFWQVETEGDSSQYMWGPLVDE